MIITTVYATRSPDQPKITAGAELVFGKLLLMLEQRAGHIAKLPPDDDNRSGYASGSARARALAMFKGGVQITSTDVAAHLQISTHYAGGLLLQLRGDGYIQVGGKKRKPMGQPVNVYTMTEAA